MAKPPKRLINTAGSNNPRLVVKGENNPNVIASRPNTIPATYRRSFLPVVFSMALAGPVTQVGTDPKAPYSRLPRPQATVRLFSGGS